MNIHWHKRAASNLHQVEETPEENPEDKRVKRHRHNKGIPIEDAFILATFFQSSKFFSRIVVLAYRSGFATYRTKSLTYSAGI